MLILSRGKNERIVIGEGPEQITILVVELGGGKVRLGIDAPRHVAVDREEVRRAKQLRSEGRSHDEDLELGS